nr:hypothetical protein [Tanacetum cinerariifolium]
MLTTEKLLKMELELILLVLSITYYCWVDVNAVEAQEEIGEGSANPTDPHHIPTIIQPSTSQPQKKQKPRKKKRKVTEVSQPSDPTKHVADEPVNEKMDNSLERAATTATSLDAEQDKVITKGSYLETTKTTQALEIAILKRRVNNLERRKRSRTYGLKRLYKVGLSARMKSSKDEGLEDADMLFDVADDLKGEEVSVSQEVPLNEVNVVAATTTTATISTDEVNLAQALVELKHTKPKAKAKWIVFHEPEETTLKLSLQQPSQIKVQDKGKGKMVEPEPIKKLSKKDRLMLDEELVFKLHAKEEEEKERIAREKAQQIEEKRRKFFAAKRAEEKRNKPPTKDQQRSIMCTYLKNMEGYKLISLKNKSFDNIQEMFDKAIKRVNTFVDYITELVLESPKKAKAEVKEGSSKRVGEELEQENAKKQKMKDDK